MAKPTELAVIPPAITFTVERGLDAIKSDLIFNGTKVSLKKDAKLNGEELGYYLHEEMKDSESRGTRNANMLRLARSLPTVKDGDKDVPAFDYIYGKLSSDAKTAGAFFNMYQLVDSLDFMEKNADMIGDKSSVFTVKNILGKFRAAKVLNEDLSLMKKLPAPAKALVTALKEGATQKRIKEVAEKVGMKSRAKRKSAKTTDTTETTKVVHTVESVVLALTTARGQWELAIKGGVKVEDMRKAALDELNAIALLCGHALVPIAKK